MADAPRAQHDPIMDTANHVLARVGLGFGDDGAGPRVRLEPSAPIVDASGRLEFGVLGILFDMASSTALAAETFRPFVHADITVHRLAAPKGAMLATASMVREGKRTGIAEIDLHDEAGTRVAYSTQEIVFKGPAPERTPEMERMRDGFRSMFDGVCRLDSPLPTTLGITEPEPGTWAMSLGPDRTNGFGGLHGGVATTLIDVAASSLAAARWGRPAATVSAAVRYLSPGMVGPFHVRPELLVDGGTAAVLRVPVVDTGADGRTIILADAHVVAV